MRSGAVFGVFFGAAFTSSPSPADPEKTLRRPRPVMDRRCLDLVRSMEPSGAVRPPASLSSGSAAREPDENTQPMAVESVVLSSRWLVRLCARALALSTNALCGANFSVL